MTRITRAMCCALLFTQASCSLSGRQQLNEAPARPGAKRWVFTPSAIASLSANGDTHGLPAAIVLGDPFGRCALFMKFPNTGRQHGRASKAFLALTPSRGATSPESTISVEAWRVRSDWQPDELHSWRDQPELAPPFARGDVTPAPAHELRIDVTDLVRFAADNPERDFGLALLAKAGDQRGAAFATGMAGGAVPRLEIYFE